MLALIWSCIDIVHAIAWLLQHFLCNRGLLVIHYVLLLPCRRAVAWQTWGQGLLGLIMAVADPSFVRSIALLAAKSSQCPPHVQDSPCRTSPE